MAARRRAVEVVEPDDELLDDDDIFADDDAEEDYEDDEDAEEGDEDKIQEWTEFTPDMVTAIQKGFLDHSLQMLAYECRERYKQLHPELFPGEDVRPTVDPPDMQVRAGNLVLGLNGHQLSWVATGVGEDGKMPPGSFRLNGNAYSKADMTGQKFLCRGVYNEQTRPRRKTIPAGTIWVVTEVHDKKFLAKVFEPEVQLPPFGFTPEEVLHVSRTAMPFKFEFHPHLFKDGGTRA